MGKKLTTQQFINRVNAKWNNEWELVEGIEYQGSESPMTLTHIPCNKQTTKAAATNFMAYGCDYCRLNNPDKIQQMLKRHHATMKEKYGVKHALQSPVIKEKIKQTNLKKYGVECSFQNKEIKEKIKNTQLLKLTSKEAKFRRRDTLREAILDLTQELGCKPTITEIQEASGLKDDAHLYRGYGLAQHSDLYTKMSRESKAEIEITNFLSQYIEVERHNRSILNGKELDIYIPSKKIAIEYCGMYWHATSPLAAHGNPKPKDYHYNKYKEAAAQGVHLITLFESEYKKNPDLIKQKLLQYIGINNAPRIHARKCEIKEMKVPAQAAIFLNQFHTQGKANASFRCGAYYNNKLVAVMQFGKNFRSTDGGYELNRFATDINYRIPGIFTKMVKWAFNNLDIERLYSYADHRWVNPLSNVYLNNGWTAEIEGKADYCYYNMDTKDYTHKSSYQKKEIARKLPEYYDNTKTEFQMMDAVPHIVRIYDCGKTKYVLNK